MICAIGLAIFYKVVSLNHATETEKEKSNQELTLNFFKSSIAMLI